jgi:hypothetical protein
MTSSDLDLHFRTPHIAHCTLHTSHRPSWTCSGSRWGWWWWWWKTPPFGHRGTPFAMVLATLLASPTVSTVSTALSSGLKFHTLAALLTRVWWPLNGTDTSPCVPARVALSSQTPCCRWGSWPRCPRHYSCMHAMPPWPLPTPSSN